MENSESNFVPEWLRNKLSGSSSPRFVSSLADRRSSSNSQRSSSSSASSYKHDMNPYSRSYSGPTRNQYSKDRERLGVDDTWNLEYSDPLASLTGRRLEKSSLGRSKSTNFGRGVESFQEREFANLRNRSNNGNGNGNGAFSSCRDSSGTHESFKKDFPSYGRDERNKTADSAPSPGLSSRVHSLSIGSSPLLSEGWTSALAKAPVEAVGSSMVSSADRLQQPSDSANGPSAPASTLTSSAVGLNDSNVTEASLQTPVQSVNVPQVQRFEELLSVGNKKLIPMTPSAPQKTVHNPSDKLKPKTAARSNDGMAGLQQISSVQLGGPAVRGGTDVPKSSGTFLLKRAQANGPSISAPLKNATDMKRPGSLNAMPVVDKRSSLAQLRSRNNFLNLMRKKSSASTTADVDTNIIVSSTMQNSDESKETTCDLVGPTENGGEICNGDACNVVEGSVGASENGEGKCGGDASNIVHGSVGPTKNGHGKCNGDDITNGSVGPTDNGKEKDNGDDITNGLVGPTDNGEEKCDDDDIRNGSVGPTGNGEWKYNGDYITNGSVGPTGNGEEKYNGDYITNGSVGPTDNGEEKFNGDDIRNGSVGPTGNGEWKYNGDDIINGSVGQTDNGKEKYNGDDITNRSVGPTDNGEEKCNGDDIRNGSVVPIGNGEWKCNDDACYVTKSCSDKGERGVNPNEVIHTAEELQFLHALGWEDDAGDDEGLTEEEINAFVKKYKTSKPVAKLFKGSQLKMMPAPESQEPCTVGASDLSKSNPQI